MKTRIRQILRALCRDKRAVTLLEYALLAALIGLALVSTLTGLEGHIAGALSSVGTSI